MYRFLRIIESIFAGNLLLLIITRILETFIVCVVPSFITVKILQHMPIRNLMYAMYGLSMLIAIIGNVLYWAQFMKVINDWPKYIIINLGAYLLFGVVMMAGYYTTENPTMYTSFFGAYRALEFFGFKTRYSLWILNILSIGTMFLTGFWVSSSNKKHMEGDYRTNK